MVQAPFDNVVSFPAGGRFAASPSERLMNEARDLMARRLRETLRPVLEHMAEELGRRGDVADNRERRTLLYGLKDSINQSAARIESQLAAQWVREFDAALNFKPTDTGQIHLEDLQLVEDGEFDEELAIKSMAHAVEDKCEDELYAVGRRLGVLAGKEDPRSEENPAAPKVFGRAWQAALRESGFDTAGRLELSNCLNPRAAEFLAPLYRELNASLVKHNILPGLRRGYARAGGRSTRSLPEVPSGDVFALLQRLISGAGAAGAGPAPSAITTVGAVMPGTTVAQGLPGTQGATAFGTSSAGAAFPLERIWASLDNLQRSLPPALFSASPALLAQGEVAANVNVLKEFRASDAGRELGQLDAITVDIVAMLFDMIFDDRDIADPIKALVGKLQIPVLKVAMLDKSFFSSRAHPARHLLDVISKAALRWGREVQRDDPIYLKIADTIDRLHAEFKQDTALFVTVCEDLEKFLAEQEDREDARTARAAPLVAKREQEELAALEAEKTLRPMLDATLPEVVADLLTNEWRLLLTRLALDGDSARPKWDAAVKTAQELIASARAMPDVQARRALARQLPVLVKELSGGFDRLNVDAERRHALFDALFTLHASLLRGAETAESVAMLAPASGGGEIEPSISTKPLDEGDVGVDSISLNAPISVEAGGSGIEGLQRGDWVEFAQTGGPEKRYRLAWISPQRGIYLFTNPNSPRALAVSPEALMLQLERGEACIVPVEPIFDRAVGRALDALKAA